MSSTDGRVRENFLDIISNFAHNLEPMEKKNNKSKLFGVLPFSKDNEQFIKIKEDISLDKNFR